MAGIIAISAGLTIMLVKQLARWGIVLSSLQETLTDSVLLTAIAAPLIWLLSLRPLAAWIGAQQLNRERSIQDNQQLLKALDIHALVSITDIEGRITHANRQFCEVSGYGEDELLGQDHRIVNSGYHDKAFMRDMWKTISQGQAWQGEVCNRNKHGSTYWVDTTIVPLLGSDGKPKHYISIRRDITKLKDNETRLLTLKRALDASNDMIIVTDARGEIQYVNPALCRSTGWEETQLLGKTPGVLDSPNADPATLTGMQRLLQRDKVWHGRLLNRRRGAPPFNIAGQTTPADPRDYWAEVSITAICNREETIIGYVQIQRDITHQVAREQAQLVENADTAARLAISEALQQTLPLQNRVTQVLDILFNLNAFDLQRKGGVFLKAPDGDFLDMFVLHGAFSEEFVRRERRIPYGDCLCGRAAVSQELLLSDDCFCDPRHDHVFEGMQAHGHYIIPIVSAGTTLGVLFLYTDPYPVKLDSRLFMLRQVSDMLALAVLHEQATKSLELARDAAERAAKLKSEFLANMSHEIRTPMNGVLGMLDLIKDTGMTAEQRDLIETASNSAESLLIVINDILDFSKLEAGKIELETIDFNLRLLVEEVCALMSVRAHDKGLELNCFLPPNLPRRWLGDPNRIRQVLTNLIGNAIKFTDSGEVSVKVFEQEPTLKGSMLGFEVADTGIGLSPESQARLFQPFTQADSSTARRFGGTGLGLSISRNLVHIMHGGIGVDSALGQGARFWFSLPLQTNEHAEQPLITDLQGKRALIVDDNATNLKILRHYLEHWGMIVSETDNAPEAMRLLEQAVGNNRGFEIMLTDLHMPGMDGGALAEAVMKNAEIADIPRLLLSSGGFGADGDRQKYGFSQALLKPVRQAVLFDAIAIALQAPAKKSEAASEAAPDVPDYSRHRLLVIEDNKVNQKLIMTLLAKFLCKADLAENGQEALDRLEQQTYDLIFMDCQMPIMDGYEAVRILRQREVTANKPRTPVIALTAHASNEDREKCLSSGMDDFLGKPIARTQLAKALARWLGPAGAGDSGREAIWNEAAALKHLDGDGELLGEMIALFLVDCPKKLCELEQAQARNDLPALADAAHALKGMAGHFYAERLIGQAAKLERCARYAEQADFSSLTNQVADSVGRLRLALENSQGATS